jgi:hypothetical protein
VHGHDQIRSSNPLRSLWASPSHCSRLPLVHPPHAQSAFRSSISLFSLIISPPRSSITHTPHTHTLHSSLHAPSRRYLFKPRSHLTSPLIYLDERGCAAFSTSLNLIKPPSFSPWVSPRNTTRRLLSINSLSTLGSLGSAKQHKLSVYRHRRLSCSLDRHHIDR